MSAEDPKYPARTELTVLPADPEQKPIGFVCHEYMGARVYKMLDGVPVEEPLKNRDDIRVGTELAVPALMGGYHVMTVEKDEYGQFTAKGGHLSAILRFGEDDRQCWVCVGLVNLGAVRKLMVTR